MVPRGVPKKGKPGKPVSDRWDEKPSSEKSTFSGGVIPPEKGE